MPDTRGLTIVGLGTGTWNQLTMEAAQTLQRANEIWLRTSQDPAMVSILPHLPSTTVQAFDHLYPLPDIERSERMASELINLAKSPRGVVFAVPGEPWMGETTLRLALERARDDGVPVTIVQGLSIVGTVLQATGLSESNWLQVLDASQITPLAAANAVGSVPNGSGPVPWRAPNPTAPLLVPSLSDNAVAALVTAWLVRYYPAEHIVCLVRSAGTPNSTVVRIPLRQVSGIGPVAEHTALVIPALAETDNVRTFAGLMQLTRTLRAPGGCPWDREQTNASLKPYLLEECYEVLDALDSGDPEQLAEELGDLLYQITIHSQVAAETGAFSIEDVIENVTRKLIGRHPHVFGDLQLETAQDVRSAWESFKQKQKPARASIFEQIPRGLPALPQSNLMQKRAASVGFEWPQVFAVLDKAVEELDELRREIKSESSKDLQREELGDVLFALVSVARHLKVDPEESLRLANRKFANRFRHVEAAAAARGVSVRDLSAQELDDLWNEAKATTTASPISE